MKVVVVVLLLVASLWAPPAAGQGRTMVLPNLKPQPRPGPRLDTLWVVGGAEDRGGVSFGRTMAVAIDSSGRILVADDLEQTIHVLDQQGKRITKIGRKGDGPGEFRLPYRLSVAPDGRVYVYDLYQGRLSEFDADLKFVRSLLLQPMLTVNHLHAGDSILTLSGTERTAGRSRAVLHQFARANGARTRSFGELLPAKTARLMYEVGPGPMAVGPTGEIWYATPGPYRLELYSPVGQRLFSAERPNDFLPPAEEFFVITEFEGRTHMGINRQARMAGLRLAANGNVLLAVRLLDGRHVIDEFTRSGTGSDSRVQLLASTIQSGPYLDPLGMVRQGLYAAATFDADGAAGLMLVRERAGR
jgi:hypothetical protein